MPAKNKVSLSPLKITVIYLIIAALWIAFTDRILESLVADAHTLSILQTYKGWLYVFLTGTGLYWLIQKHDQQLQNKEHELENLLNEVQSEKELKDVLFERIPILITIYDPNLDEFEVNKEFEKVTGWTNEEISEQNINLLKACYPDLETQKEAVEFMNNPGIGWKEFDLTTRNGNEIPTSWTDIRLTDETSVGIGIDMSEIRASEAKIRQSQEMLQKTFESLQSSVVILDIESRTIIECNHSTERIFGYSRDELIGNSTRKLHVSAGQYMLFDEISKKKLLRDGYFETEFRMKRKDGSKFFTHHTISLVYDEEGEADKVVSIVRNIDEQKKYQNQLEQRNKFIEITLDNLPMGVVVNEIDTGNTTLINSSFSEIYGWPQEAITNNDSFYEKIFPEKEYREQVLEQMRKDRASHDPERMHWDGLTIQTKDSEKKIVNVKSIPLYDQNLMISTVEDVTQQKTLEKQLLAQNRKLERAQKVAGIGYWEYELNAPDPLSWSENLKHIYALPEDYQPTIESFIDMLPPEDRPDFKEFIDEVIKKGVVFDMFRLIKPDGQEGVYHSRNELITDEEGNPSKVLGIVHEVTDLKQTEKELAKEKQRFKLVAETSSDVIWDLDITNKKLWRSKGFENIFGYERNNLTENYNSWQQYIHPDERDRVAQSTQIALASDATEWKEEYRLVKADGETAYLIDRAIIIRDDNGEAVRMIGTMNDITERKKAEQKLRESEEKYRHLFENNPEPMWIYDPDTLKFVEVNQAAINHYGYSEEEFLEMTLLNMHPQENIEALKESVKTNRGSVAYSEEWIHLKKDGSKIDVELSAADVSYENDNMYRLVLINDITEQKRIQEKIIESVIEGEDRERKRIAHELHDGLGQHLVAASMNLQSVKSDIEELSEKRQNQFDTGLSLLKNALSETRSIAHNLMPKAISDYGLIAALENLVKDFEKSSNITFTLDHNCDDLNLTNQAEINIYRIFQEIITNAIRHAQCSTVNIELKINGDTLTMIVKDDGIGAELDSQNENNGLGLHSIQTRVSNLKGDVTIDSERGEGMEFRIDIPHIENFRSNNDQ